MFLVHSWNIVDKHVYVSLLLGQIVCMRCEPLRVVINGPVQWWVHNVFVSYKNRCTDQGVWGADSGEPRSIVLDGVSISPQIWYTLNQITLAIFLLLLFLYWWKLVGQA